MSEQFDRLRKKMLDGGFSSEESMGAQGGYYAPLCDDGEELSTKVPVVRLPTGESSISRFAREVGVVMAESKRIFRWERKAVVINEQRRRFEEMRPLRFRSFVEKNLFTFWVNKDGARKLKSMSESDARACLESDDFLEALPFIKGVNSCPQPVERDDGNLVLLPVGFDEGSGIYTVDPGFEYDLELSLEDAIAYLDELFSDFSFGDAVTNDEGRLVSRSKAVVIAAMLSLFARGILPRDALVPAFIYNANTPRAGKSLLGKIAVIAVMGSAALSTLGRDEEELRKILDTEALSGSSYIFFDNVKRKVNSAALEAFLTTPVWKGRLMKSQSRFEVEKCCQVLITSNQTEVSTDIAGRALIVDLFISDADVTKRPLKKVMDDGWLARRENRKRILSALWAIVRHWDVSGRQRSPLKLAGFESWCATFGGMVLSAGFGDPIEKPEVEGVGDTDTEDMFYLVGFIVENMNKDEVLEGKAELVFQELVEICYENGCFARDMDGREKVDKEEGRFFELSARGKSSMGKIFTGYSGRVFEIRKESGECVRVQFGHRGKNRHKKYTVKILE